MKKAIFDPELIKKYDISGPRYTSYPTAPQFSESYSEQDLKQQFKIQKNSSQESISLYFHLPFCATICYFCGCNKVITKDRSKSGQYLDYLFQEIELKAPLIGQTKVSQVHLGGGTPTFLSNLELQKLTEKIRSHFSWAKDGEFAVETDPREVDEETIKVLADLGYNRMSFGVQDFDDSVQKAVNRIQSKKMTTEMVESARKHRFQSINLDLMYGLPFQSTRQFETTLDEIIKIYPDRISVFNYAHLPHLFKPQRRINQVDLPLPNQKLEMFKLAIEKLQSAGYEYIGMDHFALKNDELSKAKKAKKLNRNFQGYSTYPDLDLYAFGVSAISKIGDSFSQNVRGIDEYYQKLANQQFPHFRGYQLCDDDKIRSKVIAKIMCDFELEFDAISDEFKLDFKAYFAKELIALEPLRDDGLIDSDWERLVVTDKGRILVRIVAMVFDQYLKDKSFSYSKAI